MRELEIPGGTGRSRLITGAGIGMLSQFSETPPSVMVVDANVQRLHSGCFHNCAVITVPGGEQSKSLRTLEMLYERFLNMGLDRHSHIVVAGGGAVCDVGAFAAATFMRGVQLTMVPTTLLAQIDAGVGGKNAVNIGGYKNVVGTIRQPGIVLCDPAFLATLELKEVRNGCAEAVKHGAISDSEYFDFLESNVAGILGGDRDILESLVHQSLVIKASVVRRDELDTGERMKLNFGHTVGHAVESVLGFSHGEAVSIGMVAEAGLSSSRGSLSSGNLDRLVSLLQAFGLPVRIEGGDPGRLMDAMHKDKKRRGKTFCMTVLRELGSSVLEDVPVSELENLINAVCVTG